ncbi:MAG: dihydroneopterin aldolase [Flavobacteriaceae bacterium]|nr:dihydroneopterin aldolase [Flavobacteriaceae bacterium]|tara:strand:- start:144 stop:503 length:360 start_codon:yes stop_codon:yes gene_type:complete
MGFIKVENIRVYAHHGCLPEETIIGSEYRVDLKVEADLSASSISDALEDTVDYVTLNAIVVKEMKKSSKLLEVVAQRILTEVFKCSPKVSWVSVAVAKINPPIGGDVERVVVHLKQGRV